jgi:phytoene dehydrogenase-like protein
VNPDAVVIGSGPNGLVAGCVLARAGLRVLVLEANPSRAGGAVGSEESTRPGFIHDIGAAFFPWGRSSPAFRSLGIEERGVRWCSGRFESCHPAPDGSYACITRNLEQSERHFGSAVDGERWREIATWYRRIEPDLIDLLLRPVPAFGALGQLGPIELARLAGVFRSSGRALAERWFSSPAARRVLPGLALHADVGPDDWFGAALGFVLGVTATTGGYAVPAGGARSIADTLLGSLTAAGGQLQLGARVVDIIVRNGRAVAVRVANGEEIPTRAILADTDVASLLLDLVGREHIPARVARFMKRFPRGWGTFKLDWALDGPVPWSIEAAGASAVVHAGDSLDDLARFTIQVRRGEIPEHPYLVIGQQSLVDPSRAPAGCHTLWAYTHVPSRMEGGWSAHEERLADRIDARLEGLAPGFRSRILERRLVSPERLEGMDPNLVGGDLGGGSNSWRRQLWFRPQFPYFRYRMPLKSLYLCSSYAHPGAGVHGMCGYNAAQVALRDLN